MNQNLVPYVAPATSFVQLIGDSITTDSRRVAEFFGKQHAHVLKAIDTLSCSTEFNRSNFGEIEYLDSRNRAQRQIRITREGFTGPKAAQIKEAYIAAWNQMERELKAREIDVTSRLQRELINAQKRAVKAERGWRVALQQQLRGLARAALKPAPVNPAQLPLPLPVGA
jgi:Rha family phage regulatory protein